MKFRIEHANLNGRDACVEVHSVWGIALNIEARGAGHKVLGLCPHRDIVCDEVFNPCADGAGHHGADAVVDRQREPVLLGVIELCERDPETRDGVRNEPIVQ